MPLFNAQTCQLRESKGFNVGRINYPILLLCLCPAGKLKVPFALAIASKTCRVLTEAAPVPSHRSVAESGHLSLHSLSHSSYILKNM